VEFWVDRPGRNGAILAATANSSRIVIKFVVIKFALNPSHGSFAARQAARKGPRNLFCSVAHFGESSNTTPPLYLPARYAEPYRFPSASRSRSPTGCEPFSSLNVSSVVSFHVPLSLGERRYTMPTPKPPSCAFPYKFPAASKMRPAVGKLPF